MMTAYTLFEISNSIATLTLNRPEVHHAFNEAFIEELIAHLTTVSQDPKIRVLVLRSQGPIFCAGADLSWMQKMASYTKAENLADAKRLSLLMQTCYTLNKPSIALVQGHAFGGGVGLIACCDLAIATEHARFCFSEAKLGLCPSVISPYIIRAMGLRQTQRYFLTTEAFDASTATRLGLIHEMVKDEEGLNQKLKTFLDALLNNGPEALKQMKDLLRENQPLDESLLNYTLEHIAALRTSKEGQIGLKAFLERRKPDWALPKE